MTAHKRHANSTKSTRSINPLPNQVMKTHCVTMWTAQMVLCGFKKNKTMKKGYKEKNILRSYIIISPN